MLALPLPDPAIRARGFLGPSLTNAMIAIGHSATPISIGLTRAQVDGGQAFEDYVAEGPARRARKPANAQRACATYSRTS